MNRTHTTAAVVLALAFATMAPTAAQAQHEPGSGRHVEVTAWSRFDNFEDGTARIVMRRAHGGVVVLTHPPKGSQDIDPEISPDGKHVLFERDTAPGGAAGIVGTDGRGERLLPLPCSDPCASINDPAWTPDGRHVVYERVIGPFTGPNGNAVSAFLYRSGLDGRHFERFTDPAFDIRYEETHPSFFPDGSLVVVRVDPAGAETAIFRLRADGSHPHQLTPWSARGDLPNASPARFGPTKALVAFETAGVEGSVASRVATVPAACGSLADCTRRIHYLTSADSLPDEHFNPAWSAGGRRIVSVHYSYTDPGPAVGDIESMRFDGTDRRTVSSDPRFEFRPTAGFMP
jgi:hypothetical protein